MILWRLYYADETSFDSRDGAPDAAPAKGIIAIPYRDGPTCRVLARWNYYCWHHDTRGWWGHDLFGLYQYLNRSGWARVLFGETVPDAVWQAIMRKATSDPDFPHVRELVP